MELPGFLAAGKDCLRLLYLRAGSGPPILLLHGLLGGSFCWRFTLPALAQSHTVYAVDFPGVGLSDDRGIDCSMSAQAERMSAFMETMDLNQLTLVGCSFGGAVAMLVAARDARESGRIHKLVLSAPVNPWSAFGHRRIQLLSTTLGGYFLRAALPISRPCHGIALRRMYGDPTRMPEDALEGYTASVLRPGRAKNILTALRSWDRDVESLRTVIPQIKVPTLLVWGERDGAVDPRSACMLQQQLRYSDLKLIPGAGHLPFEEAPQEFNRAVMEFLEISPCRHEL